MRDHDQAVGRIASCCVALDEEFNSFIDENGQRMVEVKHRGDIYAILAPQGASAFTVFNIRRLSGTSGYDISAGRPIPEIEADIRDILFEKETQNSAVSLDKITEFVETEGMEFFDGIRARRPLFVHEDGFGPRQFDTALTEVGRTCRATFDDILSVAGIDLDNPEEAGSEDGESEYASGPAFQ